MREHLLQSAALGAALFAAPLAVAPGALAADARTIQERLGHPASARLLVIHADDFGMSHSVNRATSEALQKGWITSASILVPCPWFPEVARFAKENPDADLGLHLAVNSEWTGFRWGPVSGRDTVPSLLDADGYLPLEETAVVARAKPAEIERELRAQVEKARAAGIRPSHFDSHMATMFRTPEFFEVYRRVGAAYEMPLLIERLGARGGSEAGFSPGDQADALVDRVVSIEPGVPPSEWLAAYKKILAPLPPGAYQLIVHLGYDDDEMRGATFDHPNWGAAWRQSDFDLVKSPAFRDFLKEQGFVLVRWRDLAKARR